jgi:protein SCO1/2
MAEANVQRKAIIGFVALLALAALCLDSQAGESDDHKRSGKRPWGREYFPNIELVTDQGTKVRFYEDLIKNRVVMINFIFTSCGDSCPMETARLKQVYELLGQRVGQDVFFYSISIDPEFDTPSVLAAYKEKFEIGKGWTFLTGNESEIIDLRRKLSLYQEDLADSDDHNLSLIVGNEAKGKWIKRSPYDDPGMLAHILGDRLHGGRVLIAGKKKYEDAESFVLPQQGEKLFATRCAACHTLGGGDRIGPDLLGVAQKRDPAWLTRWVAEPDKMLAEKDPLAMRLFEQYRGIRMPNLGLSPGQVSAVVAYMKKSGDGAP